ncbi:MAG TPA: glycosyltransferase family 1 protein [Gemmatimonadaceae bacterium]|nr:glycosyltransferase family 1 protein [Gemmatimonadaceae bacterium]
MRIGVDATCWANARGYGRFARELMRAMTPLAPGDEFVCFGDRRAFEAWPDGTAHESNVTLVEVRQAVSPTLAAAADGNRSPADMLRLTRAVARHRPRVFFSPSVYTYFPLPPGQRAVVTIHDTIAERFPHLTLPTGRARLFWRLKVGLAVRQARLVLTVSDYSARSITTVLGVPASRIRVTVEAPARAYSPSRPEDVLEAAARHGVARGERWFIYVGGFNPHKRVDTIIEAHATLARELSAPPRLLLVGNAAGDVFLGEVQRLRALVQRVGTGDLVHWTGFVADDELRHLLSGAIASLLPSECEGFGLPAVEAAACGTPVIATRESPLPELLAGGGHFVSPGDVAALTAAMRALSADEAGRETMGCMARQRAAALTWEQGARLALDALYEAAA